MSPETKETLYLLKDVGKCGILSVRRDFAKQVKRFGNWVDITKEQHSEINNTKQRLNNRRRKHEVTLNPNPA